MENKLPRGIRNCNPLNIRLSNDKWQGMRKQQTDPDFVQFESTVYGYRAAFKILFTYINKYSCNTIGKMIHRFAPTNENDTEAYVRFISVKSGIGIDEEISRGDFISLKKIVYFMTYYENGVFMPMEEIERGYWKALNNS